MRTAKQIDREPALARGIGSNGLRDVLSFLVWQHDLFHPDHCPDDPAEMERLRSTLRAMAGKSAFP